MITVDKDYACAWYISAAQAEMREFMSGYVVGGIAVYLLCLILSILLHGYRAALKELGESVLEEREEEGDRYAKQVKHHVENEREFNNIVQVADACVCLFMGIFASWAFGRAHEIIPGISKEPGGISEKLLMVGIAIVMVLLMQAVGIIIPMRLAAHNPEQWAFGLAGKIRILSVPFLPLSWLVGSLAWVVLKMFGIDLNETESVTEEAIKSIVNEGHEQGVLEASEAEMISNIFEFSETDANEIMTHRTNVISLDGSITLSEAMEEMLQGTFSRYPVYGEDADDILGILYFRDAVAVSQAEKYDNVPIRDIPGLLRETIFIPETKSVNLLFRDMQKQKIHMAIVIDEYGQIAGIVTMEDILEEIVGNIQDEYDEEEEAIEEKEDGSFLIDGLASLDEVEELLDLDLDDEEYETLNGFLVARLDRIPQDGETPEVVWENYRFQILEVEGKVIRQVRVTKEGPKTEETDSKEEEKAKKEESK